MKRILILLCALISLSAIGQTVNVTFHATDYTTAPSGQLARTSLTPLGPQLGYNGAILTAQPIARVTDTNGFVTFTNVISGYNYVFELDTAYGRTLTTNGFPAGLTGNVNGLTYQGYIVATNVFAYLFQSNVVAALNNVIFSTTNTIQGLTNLATNDLAFQLTSSSGTAVLHENGTGFVIGQNALTTISPSGTLTTAAFVGDGSQMGNLNASSLTSGTAPTNTVSPSLLPVAGSGLSRSVSGMTATLSVAANVVTSNYSAAMSFLNSNSVYAGSNFFFSSGGIASRGGMLWTNGNWSSPDDPNYTYFLNTTHGGAGNGVEHQWTFNQLYFGPVNGGHAQFGLNSDVLGDALVMQWAGTSLTAPNRSHALGWHTKQNSGDSFFHAWTETYNTTNGAVVWHLTGSDGGGLQDWHSVEGIPILTADQDTGVEIPGYLRLGYAVNSANGTSYAVDLTNKETVSLVLSANLTLSETNMNLWGHLTNSVTIHKRIELYPELNNWTLTVPTNWSLGFDYGSPTNTWPTTITNSQMLRIDLDFELGSTATNRFAKLSYFPYSPVTDTNAAQFFAASGISDPTIKSAVNQRVLNAKAHGYWTKLIDYHPMVGGTSNTCSWNLVNTNKYRINWSGGLTFANTGVTGNGTTGVGDLTGLNPNTELSGATNSFAGIYVRGPALPTASGWFFGCNDATSGGRREGIRVSSGQANFEGGGMNNNVISDFVITASSDFRGYCFQNRVGTTAEYECVKGNAPALNLSFTAVNGLPALDMYVLAREDTSAGGFPAAADAWSNAEVNDFAYGSAFTAQNMTDFLADEVAFKTALGR